MPVLILLLVIAGFALAVRYGHDSRDGRDWTRADVGRHIAPHGN